MNLHILSKQKRIALLPLFLLLLIPSTSLMGQEKMERETGVKASAVPAAARRFVEASQIPLRRQNWYREESEQGLSYELKARSKRNQLSFEFTENGKFQDLEVRLKTSAMEQDKIEAMEEHLEDRHDKLRVLKVQIQYSGDTAAILRNPLAPEPSARLVIRYEWVISCKEEGRYRAYEYLFSEEGEILRQSQIRRRFSDNLQF